VAKSATRILVVEDDATVRHTISKLLSDHGYDVSIAVDAFDALLQLERTIRPYTLRPEHAADVGLRVVVGGPAQVPGDSGCRFQRRIRFQWSS
jgi:CheY-like chemotaxis protein